MGNFMNRIIVEAIKFGLVGLVNTAVGFGVIVIMTLLGARPVVANIIGYACGLTVSYILNSRFTFKASNKQTHKRSIVKFMMTFVFCWLCNLVVLNMLLTRVPVLAAQAAAMVCYTILFFFLSRGFVFASV